MRTIGAVVLASTMFVSTAFAAPAPLAPGKPAGVEKAQLGGPTLLWLVGLGIVAGSIALVASGNSSHTTGATTTTTGTP